MPDILHRVGIAAPVDEVYASLTTDEGLARWWTTDTRGAGEPGSVIRFRFGDGGPDFEVAELAPRRFVKWKHSGEEPRAWMGTEISFELEEETGQTLVLFKHAEWKEATDFMAHCSMKWAIFLLSLKDALETGQGRPFPDDIHIDHD